MVFNPEIPQMPKPIPAEAPEIGNQEMMLFRNEIKDEIREAGPDHPLSKRLDSLIDEEYSALDQALNAIGETPASLFLSEKPDEVSNVMDEIFADPSSATEIAKTRLKKLLE